MEPEKWYHYTYLSSSSLEPELGSGIYGPQETQKDQTGTLSDSVMKVYHPSTIPARSCQASSIQQAPGSEQDCSLLRMSHSLLQRPSPLTDLPLSNHHVHLLFKRNINLFMSKNRFQVPHPVSNKIPPAKLLFSQPGLNGEECSAALTLIPLEGFTALLR